MLSSILPKRRRSKTLLHSLAQDIANACRQEVRLKVADRCGGMSVCEMRGYVRARTGGSVRRCASLQGRELNGLSMRELSDVARMATNYVVSLIVQEHVGVALESHREAA